MKQLAVKRVLRPSYVLLALFLLAFPLSAGALDFSYQPLTGPELDIGVLYNVAISNDIVTFSVDSGLDLLYAHNIGTGETRLLSTMGFWGQNTPANYGHHLVAAHDFKILGSPPLLWQPAAILDFDLRSLTSTTLVTGNAFDSFKAIDVAYPQMAVLRFADDQPQPYYTNRISIELHNIVTGASTTVYSFEKANLYEGGHIRDIAFDGDFLAWIWCPDYGCSSSTLWAQNIATGERYELITTPSDYQVRWIDMNNNVVVYTHGPTTGMLPTTISAINLDSGQAWDIMASTSLIQYQQIQGNYLVWESYELPIGCTGAVCYSIENVYLYDLTTGQITKVTDEPGRHYFQDIQGDRVPYIDNVAGYERLMLAEFNAPFYNPSAAQALCDTGRELLAETTVVRGPDWSSVTEIPVTASEVCGLSALCVHNGDSQGNMTTRQAVIELDGNEVLSGAYFNHSLLNLSVPLLLTGGQSHTLSLDMGDIPGSTLAVRLATAWCDGDSDGFAEDVDCNDNDPAVNPAAPELCDGKDNNCNGQIDDGAPLFTYYRDADADGYGDLSVTVQACSAMQPVGYVANSTDCNDANPSVHPGALEVCDGLDNNCSGSADEGVYGFGGFGQPINPDGSSIFKAGRTIPVKASFTDCAGRNIANATVRFAVSRITDAILGTEEEIVADASGNANTDNLFRYDPLSGQYLYNLSTSGYATGTYRLSVKPDTGGTYSVNISLR